MSSKRISINTTADLAKHLGISRWAVSRAINGQPGVSEETVTRVKQAMSDLHFAPSPHARGLRGQRTQMIGVSFRGLHTAVTMGKISNVQRLVRERGYRPLLVMTENDPQQGLDVMRNFVTMHVEGVILVDAPPENEREVWTTLLDAEKIPHVLLEPRSAAKNNAVIMDRAAALQRVTEHLLDFGHRRFALLGISKAFPLGVPRHEGFCRALAARGLSFEKCTDVFDVPERRYMGLRYGRELAIEFLKSKSKATALIALDDLVATGAIWELQRAGARVPQDFSIVGFDNQTLTAQTNPSLTTVDHNVEIITGTAVEMLWRLMDDKGPQESMMTPAFLVPRDSSGPVP